MILGDTWETFLNFGSGLGGLLTGLAALTGVAWAYFRFRRTHEARLNVSIELTPRWATVRDRQAVLVRVDVHNDGGRELDLLTEDFAASRLGSRVALYVRNTLPPTSDEVGVRDVSWRPAKAATTRLVEETSKLSAGDTWHADFAFALSDAARLARVAIELDVRERPTLLNRHPEAVSVRTDAVITRPDP